MSVLPPFRRVLVANRGEIACRIVRTLDRLGIESVAVYSEADAGSAHVRAATTAAPIGPPPVAASYLNIDAILRAARETGAEAVHPGYGLLSENAAFAVACEDAGIAFVGPTPEQLREFGLKHRARELAEAAGVAVSRGSGLLADVDEAIAAATAIGFPVLLKAAAGGGGIGMHLCRDAATLAAEFDRVRRLAASHFGSADAFVEKFVARARHVEVQIFGDGRGRVIHLGERDCSLQRRRQKVFEETPAFDLDRSLVDAMCAAACRLGAAVDYRSAGTVEFLVDADAQSFFFLEVNTRLQVEHGVTEAVTGVDLVEWMLRVAAGDSSVIAAYRHAPRGAAVQVRLYAEDPGNDFRPCAGILSHVAFPPAVRVDGWVEAGTEVSPYYDPLLAKVVVHGTDRMDALARLASALGATRLDGVQTNLAYARAVTDWDEFASGRHDTRSLDSFRFEPCVVEVVSGGTMTTVQEHPGRLGYWHVGVPPSGPMDALALRRANRIAGNRDGTAGLEVTVEGPDLLFRRERVVAVTGAAAAVTVAGRPVPMWEPITVPAGARLRIGRVQGPGARCYLAVRGGFDMAEVLGSRSTFTLGGFGGHAGRALVAGDVLPLCAGDGSAEVVDAPLAPEQARALTISYPCEWVLRVVPGPHANPEFFTDEDVEQFYRQSFEVHFQSARTGVRLIGPKPRWARPDGGEAGLHPSNIHDTAYAVGSVDYTGDMPVILGPDGPSLGGFVCPAVVAGADLWKLGQLRPGDNVRFTPISAEDATALSERLDAAIAARVPWPEADAADGARTEEAATRSDAFRAKPDAAAAGCGDDGRRCGGIVLRRAASAAHPGMVMRVSGDRHVLVEFGAMVLDLELRVRVQLLCAEVERQRADGSLPGIVDVTPGVRSLQVHFDPTRIRLHALIERLEQMDHGLPAVGEVSLATRIVRLPLCWQDPAALEAQRKYMEVVRSDAPWSPSNVEFIRRINGLDSEENVRRIVYDASYLVLGLGDVYLGAPVATPLDPRHRLVTTKYNPARTWTPENAVGIGGAYMCVYGMEGPGGYQLVGRTVPVWSTYERWPGKTAGHPWLLRFFDQIRFFPCDAQELLEFRSAVRAGRREIEVEEARFDVAEYRGFLSGIAAESASFRDRQQAAFAAERQRWQASGEFDAVRRAEGSLSELTGADDALVVPEGCQRIDALLGAQVVVVGVAPGDAVQAGQELAVLSAMKAETVVTAPASGVIEVVACAVGRVVAPGTALFVLRPD